MKVLLNACPQCYGNAVLDEETHEAVCEDCGFVDSCPTKKTWGNAVLKSVDLGPKEDRRVLTFAGRLLVTYWREEKVPDSDDIMRAWRASNGLLQSEEDIIELRERGFLI